MKEELTYAFETMKYIVEQKGDWFYGGEKHLSVEGKEIKHTIGTNTISILNIYPTTSEGLQGDVDIIEYEIKQDINEQISFWKSDSFIKPSDKRYSKMLSDIIGIGEKLRYYTFDHLLLEFKQQVFVNGLTLRLDSMKNNSSIVIVSYQDKTDTLTLSNTNLYNTYFEGYHVEWKNPDLVSEKLEYAVIKKHKLPVWNYFLKSRFDPNVTEAEKRMKAIFEVANKWQIPINVQFIVSSLAHNSEVQKNSVLSIIKQNHKTFASYEKHFGSDWKKRFNKEVEDIMTN